MIESALEGGAGDEGGWLTLLVLGALQGATEFLPVSSSGHLVIIGEWMGGAGCAGLSTEVALHFGTLVSVVLFCRRDLGDMVRMASSALWRLVIGASLVTAVVGLSLGRLIEANLATPPMAGTGLLVTAALLACVAPRDDTRLERTLDQGTWRDALLLGLFQSLALMPGISRAGATLTCALLLGFQRSHAVRVAFLVSIPAVGGAVLLKARDGESLADMIETPVLAGTLLACLVGIAALRFVAVHVDPISLRRFACYCAGLGLAAILTAVAFG